MNVTNHVEAAALRTPTKIALCFEKQVFSYAELDALGKRAANAFGALGVGRGDRVALYAPNLPAFIMAYLGALKLGAVVVTINTALKAEETKFILDDSGATLLLTTDELYAGLAGVDLPQVRQVIFVEGAATGQTLALDALLARASAEFTTAVMHADDPAAIHYTSGTTGFPKGAAISHGNVIANRQMCVEAFDFTADDRLLLCLPLFHSFSQTGSLNPCFEAGATLLLHRQFEAAAVTAAIEAEQVTRFIAVPSLYLVLYEQATPAQLRSVRHYLSSATTLPVEVARKWQDKYGVAIDECYGLTETGVVSFNGKVQEKIGSVGRALTGVELCVVNAEGQAVAPGTLGEVVVRGPNLMLGYWQRPADTAEVLRAGWFYTGDIGHVDDDGYFYIVDRIKDMINISGTKVYSSEVENVLYRHPAVQEAAVYGIQDPVLGEKVCASIVARPESQARAADLIAFAHHHLADFKVPTYVEFVDLLPKSRTGKILKRTLRERVQNQSNKKAQTEQTQSNQESLFNKIMQNKAPDEAAPALTEVENARAAARAQRTTPYVQARTVDEFALVYLWEELFGFAPIGIHDNFFELGGHSMLAMSLVVKVREQYNKQFPISIFLQYPTIADFAPLLQAGEGESRWSPVVPIRTKGSKPPFFCIPGSGSNGLYLYPLCHALGEDQPFYALQSIGLDGVTPPNDNVEDEATAYLKAIKEVQPAGPYYLGGHSYGGWIAFEMAQQLIKAGEQVGALAMIEALPLASEVYPLDDIEIILILEVYYVKDAGKDLGLEPILTREMLEPLTLDERCEKLMQAMQRVYAAQASSVIEVRGLVNVTMANLRTIYQPKEVVKMPFTYFLARGVNEEGVQQRHDTLGPLGDVTWVTVPGEHTSCLTEPKYAEVTAAAVAAYLEKARETSVLHLDEQA